MRCHICHRPAQVGNPELAATLCSPCDDAFIAWYAANPGRPATDCPAWNRRRPGALATPAEGARDEWRDLVAGATNTRPLRVSQANTLTLWHQYREQATA